MNHKNNLLSLLPLLRACSSDERSELVAPASSFEGADERPSGANAPSFVFCRKKIRFPGQLVRGGFVSRGLRPLERSFCELVIPASGASLLFRRARSRSACSQGAGVERASRAWLRLPGCMKRGFPGKGRPSLPTCLRAQCRRADEQRQRWQRCACEAF